MADGGEAASARGLRAIFGPGGGLGRDDAELLARFAAGGEAGEAAFEAIVERHGPMVLRACRGLLRDGHAADDAFQATFLVLARRAGGLRVRGSLGPWLFGVARRVAARAKVDAARRLRHERAAAEAASRPFEVAPAGDDLAPALFEAIAALPDRYRAAVVLCDLQGMTHEQAAGAIGCPAGTVKSRLSRGRDRLRRRLEARGLGVPSVLLAAESPAPALVRSAIRAATVPGAASPTLLSLGGTTMRTMLLADLRPLAAAVALVATTAALGVAYQRLRPSTPPPPPPPVAAPAPASAPPEPAEAAFALQKAAIDVQDLIEVSGIHLWKYRVEGPAGKRFRVVFRELTAADAPPRVLESQAFRKMGDGPVTLRIQIRKPDGSFGGVLLGRDEWAALATFCQGCEPGGIDSTIRLPFRDRMEYGGQLSSGPNGTLQAPGEFVVMATKPMQKIGEPSSSYPCAQLVIVEE